MRCKGPCEIIYLGKPLCWKCWKVNCNKTAEKVEKIEKMAVKKAPEGGSGEGQKEQ